MSNAEIKLAFIVHLSHGGPQLHQSAFLFHLLTWILTKIACVLQVVINENDILPNVFRLNKKITTLGLLRLSRTWNHPDLWCNCLRQLTWPWLLTLRLLQLAFNGHQSNLELTAVYILLNLVWDFLSKWVQNSVPTKQWLSSLNLDGNTARGISPSPITQSIFVTQKRRATLGRDTPWHLLREKMNGCPALY